MGKGLRSRGWSGVATLLRNRRRPRTVGAAAHPESRRALKTQRVQEWKIRTNRPTIMTSRTLTKPRLTCVIGLRPSPQLAAILARRNYQETVNASLSPIEMVGAARFELATSCTPSKRASRATLRPGPFRRLPRGNGTMPQVPARNNCKNPFPKTGLPD